MPHKTVDELFAEVGTPSECMVWLIDAVRRGALLQEFMADPPCVHCRVSKVVISLELAIVGHDDHEPRPNVFGATSDDPLIDELATALGLTDGLQAPAGPITSLVVKLVVAELIRRLTEMINEWREE